MADNSWMGDEPLWAIYSFATDGSGESPSYSIRGSED